ncbi:hypothetical protein [Maridesulfovibrio bastinii]|uniref:hypothetical protein n=1 Tax=Maridesulfovibrio bastinii TaxID=47157 RepID=UPI0004149497|nr:hypothetical protein [Maridesulfovibrio bastinii]
MRAGFMKVLFKVFIAVGFFALVTMVFWNWLMPEIFGLPELSYFQTLGLLILSRLLFGGFSSLREMSHFIAHREREALFESWHSMTPEQRAECFARVRSRRSDSSATDHRD